MHLPAWPIKMGENKKIWASKLCLSFFFFRYVGTFTLQHLNLDDKGTKENYPFSS